MAIGVGLLTIYFRGMKQPERCEFALEDIKTYFNEYSRYAASWDFEGLLRNKSQKKQYLKAMVTKLYNEEGILIGDGYTGVGQNLDGNTAVPFNIRVYADRNNTAQWHYYEESLSFNPDIYPWFTTCK